MLFTNHGTKSESVILARLGTSSTGMLVVQMAKAENGVADVYQLRMSVYPRCSTINIMTSKWTGFVKVLLEDAGFQLCHHVALF